LPPIPGSAYLKVSEAAYRRFRVAHMSGPYHPPGDADALESAGATVTAFGLRTAPPDRPDDRHGRARSRSVHTGPTSMQVAVQQLCRFGESVHQVWLPPLPPVIALDALLGPLAEQPSRGWQAAMWPRCGRLSFPVGLIDLPFQQRQEPLILDFARKHGNLAVVGAPQTGKSGLLRTLMLSAMLTHTPAEMQFYCLDYGGGTLAPLAAAPHVGAVAGRRDPQTAGRLLSEMLRLITAREQMFAEHAVDSPAAFRTLAGSGRLPAGTRAADVFVVIDNWGAVRADLEDADAAVTEIAFRGLGVGVHLILTANRWADIRVNLRDGIGARLELRLNDPAESEVNRQLARQLAASPAGRGVAPPGLLFHSLAPRLDGMETMEDIGDSQDETIAKIAASWTGVAAPPIRLLPDLVRAADLAGHEPAGSARSATAVPVGLGDADLGPVSLDLSEDDPHLLVLGDAGGGKTVFLHTLLHGLAGRHGPNQVRFMLVDYRRSLLDALPQSYVGAYAGDASAAREYTSQLAAKLAERMPPPGLSSSELQARTWWTGPELYLVADDYDLAATGQTGPLAPLIDYIPQAREIGLHVILARRVSGMSRALTSDPLLTRIRDLGTAGLILSGDAREGILLGTERAALRPPGRGMLIRRRQPPVLIQVATATGLPEPLTCSSAPS
jgi:S-DNA-T family DNA segregation ATPase FtsK/SpoIIIE